VERVITRSWGPGVGVGRSLSSRLRRGLERADVVWGIGAWSLRVVDFAGFPLDVFHYDCFWHCGGWLG